MFPILSENPWSSPGSRFRPEKPTDPLAVCFDDIARLRFSINLAAQYADSPSQTPARQQELRARLVVLQRQYSSKMDEINLIIGLRKVAEERQVPERGISVCRGIGLPFAARIESIDPCA